MKESHSAKQFSTSISESPKGQYHWVYEVNLYRNPTFLFLLWKIFFFIWLGIAIFVLLLSASGNDAWETCKSIGMTFLYIWLFLMGLLTVAYYFYALFMKGRYIVSFEMTKKGIRHAMVPPPGS